MAFLLKVWDGILATYLSTLGLSLQDNGITQFNQISYTLCYYK